MTDLEVFKRAFNQCNIPYEQTIDSDGDINIEIGDNGKDIRNTGYVGFVFNMTFHKEGKLLVYGAYE